MLFRAFLNNMATIWCEDIKALKASTISKSIFVIAGDPGKKNQFAGVIGFLFLTGQIADRKA